MNNMQAGQRIKNIHETATIGNIELLSWLVEEKHMDIDQQDAEGCTALHRALMYADVATVQWLIKHGANLNAISNLGYSALDYLVFSHANTVASQYAKLRFLLTQGYKFSMEPIEEISSLYSWIKAPDEIASIKAALLKIPYFFEKKGTRRLTLLHYAAALGCLDAVIWLINVWGANVGEEDINKRNTLIYAAGNGHVKVVHWLLLEQKIDINKDDKDGATALHMAASHGHLEIVELLVENGADIKKKTDVGRTAIHFAAKHNHLSVLKYMLGRGADITGIDRDETNILHLAASEGHLDLIKWIIAQNKLAIGQTTSDGATAFSLAVHYAPLPVVKYFLEELKVPIEGKDGNGCTAWLQVGKSADIITAKYLLTKGADTNITSNNGSTVFLFAARGGHLEMMQWLLANGFSKIDEIDNDGFNALHHAAGNGHLAEVQWLVSEGKLASTQRTKDGVTPLCLAATKGHQNIVQWLIATGGADITEEDGHGFNALLLAAACGHLEIVQYLLNTTIPRTNQTNITSFLLAASSGKIEVVKWLLEKGHARIDEKSNDGNTALHGAADSGELTLVQHLLQKGANINERDADKFSALHFAILREHLPIVKCLLENGADFDSDMLECIDNSSPIYFCLKLQQAIYEQIKYHKEVAMLDLRCHLGEISNQAWEIFCQEVSSLKLLRLTINGAAKLSDEQKKMLSDTVQQNNQKHYHLSHSLSRHLFFNFWNSANEQSNPDKGIFVYVDPSTQRQLEYKPSGMALTILNEQSSIRNNKANFVIDVQQTEWQLTETNKILDKDESIFMAAKKGHITTLAWWITERNENINLRNDNGVTSLHIAAAEADLNTVQWLLAHGANRNAITGSSNSVLVCAIFFHANTPLMQQEKLAYLLSQGCHFPNEDIENIYLWMNAKTEKEINALKKELIKIPYQSKWRGRLGQTLLHYACAMGCLDAVFRII